jgi:DNA-binding beta-propeller fold protein YncE
MLSVAVCVFAGFARAEEPALKLERTIALPGVEGRFDHAAADPETKRLFFAALGNNTLEIVDIASGTRVHTIRNLRKPTGVLFLRDSNSLVVANGDDGTCRFFDGKTYAETGRITGLEDADNVRLDRKANRIYLGYGEGGLAVIDPAAMKVVGRIALKAHPESFQLEENGPRIFINVPDARQIVVIDRERGTLADTWPLADFRANFPMALDEARHRLYVGCRQPARLLVLDTATGKRVVDRPLSGDTDDLFYDASTKCLIASCGEGFVDVVRGVGDASPAKVERLATAAGARTSLLIPQLGLFCLAVPHRGAQGAEIRVYASPNGVSSP